MPAGGDECRGSELAGFAGDCWDRLFAVAYTSHLNSHTPLGPLCPHTNRLTQRDTAVMPADARLQISTRVLGNAHPLTPRSEPKERFQT
jgi:hypothetical protein